MVAIPILLSTRAAIDEQIGRLEVHHLSNPAGEIYFALLSDWTDAVTESTAEDAGLLAAVTDGITELNTRYPNASGADRFFLLHRRRGWNEAQRRWIGWERKRGKLHELNHLLRGSSETTFLEASDRSCPPTCATWSPSIRIHDCRATRSRGWSARWRTRSTGRASIRIEHRVTEGYGVLQPRVTPSLPVGAEGSLFQRIFSSNSGNRSLFVGGLRRLSGPVRRGLVLRKGHLRHRCLRGRPAGPRPRQHDVEPRSVRGRVRPLGARVRYRGGRGISRPLRRGRARASIAGREATGSCCRGCSAW